MIYELTPLGMSLSDVLYAMKDWGEAVPDGILAAPVPERTEDEILPAQQP